MLQAEAETMSPFRILCATGFFAIFSSTISKSPVLPFFASWLGADPAEVGMVASVSAFTGVVASVPSGFLADHYGRRRMLLIAAAVFATAPLFYFAVSEIWQLVCVRLYHGIATAIFIPVAMALVSELHHQERGEKLGWFSTATLLGRFLAPVIGGSLLSLAVLSEAYRFHAVYAVCVGAGALALVLALRLPQDVSCRFEERSLAKSWAAFREIIASRAILITCIVEAAILFVYGTFETFLPLAAIKSGISAGEVGILLAAQVITLALSKPLMGRFSDRHGRQPQIFWGAVLGAVCIGLFSFAASFPVLLGLSILLGLSLSILSSASSAYIADSSTQEARASAMGMLGSIMDIGHSTGPLIAGFVILSFGFQAAFLGAASVLAAAAVLFALHAKQNIRIGFHSGGLNARSNTKH